MKIVSILLLTAAGGALAWIAVRSPERDYAPLVLDEDTEPEHVPIAVIGEIPAGHVVRKLDVEGMCCHGCTGKLYAALTELPSVVRAAVNFDAGTASALVSEELDVAALTSALTFDKYSASPRD